MLQIKDKQGAWVDYQPNVPQRRILKRLRKGRNRLVVLKSRQHGVTTGVLMEMLERMMRIDGYRCGVISMTQKDGEKLIREKVLPAYKRHVHSVKGEPKLVGTQLIDEQTGEAVKGGIKRFYGIARETTFSLVLENGSSLEVGISLRGGTYDFLHVSEFGKIASLDPRRGEEIVSGAFQTVPQAGVIIVESTFHGAKGGLFYDMVQGAMDGTGLWELMFFPWYLDFGNRLTSAETEKLKQHAVAGRILSGKYYDEVQEDMKKWYAPDDTRPIVPDHKLDMRQKAWHASKVLELGWSRCRQEHPSTLEECFAREEEEGVLFAVELNELETRELPEDAPIRDGQTTLGGVLPGLAAYVQSKGLQRFAAWDIGFTDATSVWVYAFDNGKAKFIDYLEMRAMSAEAYAKEFIKRHGATTRCVLPHDASFIQRTGAPSYQSILYRAGLTKLLVLPKTVDRWMGVGHVRRVLARSEFDKEYCRLGVERLGRFRAIREFKGGRLKFVHDEASHAADAFRYMAEADMMGAYKEFVPKDWLGEAPALTNPDAKIEFEAASAIRRGAYVRPDPCKLQRRTISAL